MKTIFLEHGFINMSFSSWYDIIMNSNHIYDLTKSYIDEVENFIRSKINSESETYLLFHQHMNSYNFHDKNVTSFHQAASLMNESILFKDIFHIDENIEFENNLFMNCKLMITQTNKLMLIDKNELIFNEKMKVQVDNHNRCITIVQLYKIVHCIKFYEKTIEMLCNEVSIELIGSEITIKNENRLKIAYNLATIDDISHYHELQKLIGKNLFVLKAIQLIALNNTYSTSENRNKEIIMLLTSSYLRQYLECVAKQIQDDKYEVKVLSESYLRRLLIMYQKLGLLTLVNPTKKLMNRENKKTINRLSYKYYIINKYDNTLLAKANDIAKELLADGINVSQITIKNHVKTTKEKEELNEINFFLN